MTTSRSTDTLAALQSLIAQGESETLELKPAGETLCALLNGEVARC